MTPAPAAPVLIQLEQHRLAARAAAEEPAARAEGRFLELVLEMQRLSCACTADTVFLKFAELLPALREGQVNARAQFQSTIDFALETLKAGAVRTAAENGLSPLEGEQMATVGAEGFIARMNAVLAQAQGMGQA